jgi:hypothetical protein
MFFLSYSECWVCKAIMAYMKVLSRNSPGDIEENQENFQ